MAANSKAIGLLFEVAGAGNINGETGKRINSQLRSIVGAINKSATVKLKFTIDKDHFKKEVDLIKKEADLIKKQLQNIKIPRGLGGSSGKAAKGGGSGENTKGGDSGKTAKSASQHTEAWKQATASVREYYRIATQVQQAQTRTTSISGNAKKGFSGGGDQYELLVKQANAAKAAMESYTRGINRANLSKKEQTLLNQQLASAQTQLDVKNKAFETSGRQAWSNLTAKVHDYINRVEASASRNDVAKQKLKDLRTMANSTNWRGYDALKDKLGEVQAFINQNSLATEKWYQKMLKTFGTRVRSLLSGLVLAKVTTSLRDIYKNVVEIDTAMTELKIVTQENDTALQRYEKTVEKAAQKIGASMSDLIKSTTTYARLGFSLDDAGILGELTTAYSKVGDVSVDDATRNITGIVKAYRVDANDLESVIDKLIYVGRRFAISSAEIGEGMNNAASSLYANGNTLNQAMGILTAANTTVQDISRASTATRTIAARLSASKQELEELGETVEADTIVKLEKAFQAYGIAIKDGNGNLKSTYNILGSIADKWKELSSEERAAITSLAAGTRQQDIFYSIIQNWNDAKRVVAEAGNSTGELADATAERLDSIQGRIDQLKAKYESLSQSLLSGGFVKMIVDGLGAIVSALNGIASAGDGIVIKSVTTVTAIWAIIAALVKLKAFTAAAALSLVDLRARGLLGILTVIPKLTIGLIALIKQMGLAKVAALGFKGVLNVLHISPTMLAITALIGVFAGGAAIINHFANARADASEKAKEHADAMQEAAEKAREESASIDELIDRYKELASSGSIDAEHRKEVRDIQKQINLLTGKQAGDLDLINGKLDEQVDKLAQIKADKAKGNLEKSKNAYFSAQNSANLAYETNLEDAGWAEWASNWAGADLIVDGWDSEAADIIDKLHGVSAMWDTNFVSTLTQINFTANNAEGYIQRITEAMTALENDPNYDVWNSEVYKKLGELRSQYETYTAVLEEREGQFVADVVEWAGYQKQADGVTVETLDDYNNLRNQLIAVTSAQKDMSAAVREGTITQQEITDAVDDFLARYYGEKYDELTRKKNGETVALKSLKAILEEVQDGYDGISKAFDGLTEDGYLTADMLSTLAKLEEDGALAGLKLNDILIQDANGYKIAEDALQKYVDALIAQYTITGAFATLQDKENAIANLENLRRVLYTLSRTQNKSTDATKAQKEALEDQKDALKDQLDAYKKLIDLRKELLKQYEDELTYKKELAQKERRVSQLQTQLAVSQLDTSAAGRAKTRQLTEDLKEAQDDLDDFTLEHAINVVTNELDTQYAEYENYINGEIDGIEQKIDAIGDGISSAANSIASAMLSAAEKIAAAIASIKDSPVVGDETKTGSSAVEQARSYIMSHGLMQGDKARWGQDPEFRKILNQLTPEEFAALEGYKEAVTKDSNGKVIGHHKVAPYPSASSFGGKSEEDIPSPEDIFYKATDELKKKLDYGKFSIVPQYHSGGIVGDMSQLKSNEMFAKLLKGEFVATPKMMSRFMNSTLPEIASTGGVTEINSPLISIQCDNVTQESMPRLEEVVKEAVKSIKKQFDDGLGRAGYRRTVKQMT